MKKILYGIGFALAIAPLSGCSQHDHTFSDKWYNDETNHWHAATCGHDELTKDLAAHDYGDDDVCDTCGYVRLIPHEHAFSDEWSNDETNHWHAATCGHDELTKDLAAHDYGDDDVCDTCGYVRQIPHEHSFADKWSYDESNHWHAATCEHKDITKDFNPHVDMDEDDYCDICGHFLNEGTYFFVVAFVDGNNLLHDPIIVAINESVYRPNDPTKEGHDFINWYETPDFSGDPYNFETPVTRNLTLYAKFKACEYKITYHNVENLVHNNPTGYTYGVGVESFDNEAYDRTGKDRFYGWYFDKDFSKPASSISKTSTKNIDLYAKRSEIFHITYENWPEDIPNPNPQEYTAYDEIKFDCGFTKDYPGFKNFVLKENNKTIDKIPLGSSGNKTITASYELTKTKVTFDPNGGYLIPDQTYLYVDFGEGLETKKLNAPLDNTGSTINIYDQTVLEVPQKEGYYFGGYYLGKDFKTRISETENNVLTCGSTIYAKWLKIPTNFDGVIPVSGKNLAALSKGNWEIVKDFNLAIPYYIKKANISSVVFAPTIYDGLSAQEITIKAIKENGESDIFWDETLGNDDAVPVIDFDENRDVTDYRSISVRQKFYRIDSDHDTTGLFEFNIKLAPEDQYRKGNICVQKTNEKYEEEYSYWDVPAVNATREGYILAGWFDNEGRQIDFANRWVYIDKELKVKAVWMENAD